MIGFGLGLWGRQAPRWTPARLASGVLRYWSGRTLRQVATATDGTGAADGLSDSSKAAYLADLSAQAIPLVQGTGASQPIVGYSDLGRGIALIADGGQSLVGGSSLSGVRHLYVAVTFSGTSATVTSEIADPFATESMTVASTSGAVNEAHSLLVGLTAQQLWTSASLSGPAYVNGVNTTSVGRANVRRVIRFDRNSDATTGALNLFQSSGGSLPARCIVHEVAGVSSSATSRDHAALAAYFNWHRTAPVVACTIDSLTAGYLLTSRQGYPWLLHRDRWRGCVSVPNLGVVGQTLVTALSGDPAKLAAVKGNGTNIVVLLAGANDIDAGATAATVWTRLQSYITAAVADGWQVVVCSIPQCPGFSAGKQAHLATLQTTISGGWQAAGAAAFVDLYPLTLTRQADGVHFTSADCQIVADAIGDVVDDLL